MRQALGQGLDDEPFDYVVVGGGTAGCVLASRLTEDAGVRVLLLEAGSAPRGLPPWVPALVQKLGSDLNWLYPTEQDASRGGACEPYSGGRALGGSSTVNSMMWVRGNRADYDAWEQAGCAGWGSSDVLAAFRRTERFEDGSSAWRGGTGPVRVCRSRVSSRLTEAFLEGAAQTGLPRRADYNAEDQVGVSRVQVNQRRGVRSSAYSGYLRPALRRPGLVVRTGAHARRVLLHGRRAVGVEYEAQGRRRTARARREVLLCTGAVGSPHLLQLSGIGPADDLARHGVDVVVDLPGVGKRLQDHPATTLTFEVTERTLNQDLTPLRLLRHGADFVLRGRGAVTSTASHAVAFAPLSPGPAGLPDAELIFMAFGLAPVEGSAAARRTGRLQQVLARSGGREDGRRQAAAEPLVTVQPVVLRPRSEGEVVLRSADPGVPPLVRQQLLAHPDDVRTLVQAARLVRTVFRSRALAPLVVRERRPGPEVDSSAEWEAYVREHTFRLHHASSTCAMGTGPGSVVDARLRVHGVEGLRVVDASVMPDLPRGNTHAPTLMIGERGSELVREDARRG